MRDSAYSASALDANRAGQLSPDQMRSLQVSVRFVMQAA